MGMSRRRKAGRRRGAAAACRVTGAMADINMTPFIDVMLVLLIIFMVAAPLLATGVPIDLPQTKASALNIDQKPLSVAIDEKGAVFVMDEPVTLDQLADKLKAGRQGRLRRAHLCARRQRCELRQDRRGHVDHHDGRLQEGRSRHGAGKELSRRTVPDD